jgi:hypothetical protein
MPMRAQTGIYVNGNPQSTSKNQKVSDSVIVLFIAPNWLHLPSISRRQRRQTRHGDPHKKATTPRIFYTKAFPLSAAALDLDPQLPHLSLSRNYCASIISPSSLHTRTKISRHLATHLHDRRLLRRLETVFRLQQCYYQEFRFYCVASFV